MQVVDPDAHANIEVWARYPLAEDINLMDPLIDTMTFVTRDRLRVRTSIGSDGIPSTAAFIIATPRER